MPGKLATTKVTPNLINSAPRRRGGEGSRCRGVGWRQLDNSAGAWIISSCRPLCLRLCLDTGNRWCGGKRKGKGWGIGMRIGIGIGFGSGRWDWGLRFKASSTTTASALLTKVLRVFFGFGIAKEASGKDEEGERERQEVEGSAERM